MLEGIYCSNCGKPALNSVEIAGNDVYVCSEACADAVKTAVLREELENLKCCGNCFYFKQHDMLNGFGDLECRKNKKSVYVYTRCSKWEPDKICAQLRLEDGADNDTQM